MMLIRVSGYNDGVKEYLEEGIKNGRDFTREELDERVILYGDLALTEMVYQQIPDNGQDRYITMTLSFREDEVSFDTLHAITKETRQFLMYAYEDEEYNFYAEAHIPKLKEIQDKKTGGMIERKPHIHIVIPKKNLLSGRMFDPVGSNFGQSVKYLESFQEYINQKYKLASPREHVRVDPTSAADVLSRYKGDDFRSKNQDFKKQLVADVIEKNIASRADFYQHVTSFGDTKIRNKGKDNEYIAVKLPGDAKFTNLKETIFHDDFIVRREVKKPPLDKAIIRDRLLEWPQRAKEIKYVSKATPKFRQLYKAAEPAEKIKLLADRQAAFYAKHRGQYELHPAERQRDHQRGIAETESRRITGLTDGLQGVSGRDVAVDRHSEQARNTVLLPGDAHLHLGQPESTGGIGLRSDLSARRGNGNAREHDFDKFTAVPGVPTVTESALRRGYAVRGGMGGGSAGTLNVPPYALNPHRVASLNDIKKRGDMLFGQAQAEPRKRPTRVNPIRRVMPRPDKKASFVAAYFLRRLEQDKILPAQRREIYTIDKRFFETRRTILADERLNRNEKSQFVSVLTFERLKAHHAIKHPNKPFEQESPDMGSAAIRNLMNTKRLPDNSISGPEEKDVPPARERFSKIIQNINTHMAEKREKDSQRGIAANDLYTKRARFSQNVHYLDKKTDKTLFVDTGKAIAVRKGCMTESAVAVALELAKEKFGSTLTIKGSQQFKDQVIEVAAKNSMDVHFTDKAMNKQLAERREELAIEKDGQRIEQPATATAEMAQKDKVTETESPARETDLDAAMQSKSHDSEPRPGTANTHTKDEKERYTVTQGVLLEHGAAPYKFKPDMDKPENERDNSYYVKLQMDDGRTHTLWGVGLESAVEGLKANERVQFVDKGVEPVRWTETLDDGSTVAKSGNRRVWEGEPLEREREQKHDVSTPQIEDDGPDVA
ncbi:MULTISPECIES: LPD7 domain-containing protein [Serratia]|uniref:LPD7 domain-containing protein n=1 Tax=Serratia TaxID=613 RepID=UPI000B11D471|nr:LPD7 domain-containing protein [Serratia sp. 506_PEND]